MQGKARQGKARHGPGPGPGPGPLLQYPIYLQISPKHFIVKLWNRSLEKYRGGTHGKHGWFLSFSSFSLSSSPFSFLLFPFYLFLFVRLHFFFHPFPLHSSIFGHLLKNVPKFTPNFFSGWQLAHPDQLWLRAWVSLT